MMNAFMKNDGGQGWIGDCFAIPRLRFATAQPFCLTAIADSAVVRTQPCQNKKALIMMMNAFFKLMVGRAGFEPAYTCVSRFTVCRL